MKEKDIREIEDTIYQTFLKKNRFYLINVVVFVFSIFLGASISLLITKL